VIRVRWRTKSGELLGSGIKLFGWIIQLDFSVGFFSWNASKLDFHKIKGGRLVNDAGRETRSRLDLVEKTSGTLGFSINLIELPHFKVF